MDVGISYHDMLCIKDDKGKKNQGFKFINKVLEIVGNNDEVSKSWRSVKHFLLLNNHWTKLMRLKPMVKRLSKPLMGLGHQIEKAKNTLAEAHQ